MARVLDLNSVEIPGLELTLLDEARTTIHVTVPTEELINELEHMRTADLQKLKNGDQAGMAETYNLTAKLISCNQEGITMTARELREKYRVKLPHLLVILNEYMGFINELKNEKN